MWSMTELGLKVRGNLKAPFFVTRKVLRREKRKEKNYRKIKNRFLLNKLILYVYSNSFNLFLYYIRTKKFKNM